MSQETAGKFGYSTNFFQSNDVVKIAAGLWRPTKDKSLYLRISYLIYIVFIYLNAFGYLTCEYLIIKHLLKDIPRLLSHIGMILTHTLGIFKLRISVCQQKSVNEIMDRLQDDRFKYVSLNDDGPREMLKTEQANSSRLVYLTFVMYAFVGGSAQISTLCKIFREIPQDTFEGTNKTCYDFMPYSFQIPFSAETKWKCILASTFMNLGLTLWAFIISYYDGVFVSLLKCFKIQLVIAEHFLINIRERCMSALGFNEHFQIIHDEDYPKLEEEMHRQLGHVIEHLKLLLKIRNDIEKLSSFVSLAQSLCSLFIFASCLYVASTVEMMSPEFFAQLQFFCCVLIQLSIICWSANEITIAGQNIGNALYCSDWFSCSKRFKRSMILTMIRMQQPIILTIGKFTPLTITTLVNVCRGSFSYFALFKSVK